MAKRRRNTRRSTKNKSSLGQWIIVVIVGVLTYKAVDYFLPRLFSNNSQISQRDKSTSQKQQTTPKKSSTAKTENKTENAKLEETDKKEIKNLSFQETQKLLPKDAFKDNFETIAMEKESSALIAHSKLIPGKKPDPKGESNTQPGLRYLKWDGKDYQKQDLNFKELKPALGSLASKNMVGMPKIEQSPFYKDKEKSELYLARLFFDNDSRDVLAVVEVDEKGAHWASLNHASGKKIPAAFSQGTTKDTTRKVIAKQYQGKPYIVVENGELDEFRPYAGYLWTVQAYYWNGKKFVYDSNYSESLTRTKRLSGSK